MPANHNISASRLMDHTEIAALVREELDSVEKSIRENYQSNVAMIPLISGHLANGGGKRLRPILVLLTAKLCGYNGGGKDITHSTVVEYIHAATLLHDDVVDSADLRRGVESANAKWGNGYAVLVGDYLFAKTLSMMSEISTPEIIGIVSEATKYLAEGEILQLVHSTDIAITEEKHLDILFRKTGALIMACCKIGGELGDASPEQKRALAIYGKNVGIAFQMVDDLLDFTSDEQTLGKPVGQDLVEGHVTMPVIHTYQNGTAEERSFLEETVKDENLTRSRMGRIVDMLNKYESIDYTTRMARNLIDSSISELDCFPAGKYLDALKGLAEYVVRRTT